MTHAEIIEIITAAADKFHGEIGPDTRFTIDFFKGNDQAIPPWPDQYRVRIVIGGMVAAKATAGTLADAATIAVTRTERRIARWRRAGNAWATVRAQWEATA